MLKFNLTESANDSRFGVYGYYDTRFRDVSESEEFDDLSDAESYAHELLANGNVSIVDYITGDEVNIDADEYWDKFDGEFACLPTIAKWQDNVWKSMGIGEGLKKSVKESASSEIPYDLVSMLVIIRDFRDTDSAYVSDEHKKLVDIADAIYNNGSGMIDYMDDDYKALYNKYGKKYFDLVIDDVEALDSQVSPSNINDLLDDYSERANSFLGESTNHKKSRKAIKEDTFDNEDWGYGFDSNGNAIDESTVDELYRIAERDILPKTELAKIDEYVSIDEDSFEFYMSSPWVQESFTIIFEMTTDDLDMMSYVLPDAEWIYDYNGYGSRLDNLKFFIDVKNGEVSKVTLVDHSVRDIDDGKYDVEKLESYVAELASSAATAIYNGTTNL